MRARINKIISGLMLGMVLQIAVGIIIAFFGIKLFFVKTTNNKDYLDLKI